MTFDVMEGECIGLVGNNGSGKSTLLKVASGIIRPSSGRVEIRGRLSALLELGAGFHPDLTGKENIWLNASILGLSNNDVNKIYNDIVEFSELGEFINMPVKHYSSGMYMRLGFSVAVHIEPDILLIDEILAVGDQSFQEKCIQRLHKLNNEGVTVIFVSHTLETVRALCTRIFWIADGQIVADGDTNLVLNRYIASHKKALTNETESTDRQGSRWGNGEVKITGVKLLDEYGEIQEEFEVGKAMIVELDYSSQKSVKRVEFGLSFFREDGTFAGSPEKQVAETESAVDVGSGTVRCHIQALPLQPAIYDITATIYEPDGQVAYDHFEQAKTFQVIAETSSTENLPKLKANWELNNSESISKAVEGGN
jgi:ABC-type polysaccharide/polyol phosphate transport system ATPase subunit